MRHMKISTVLVLFVFALFISGCSDSESPVTNDPPGQNSNPWAGLPVITPEMIELANFSDSNLEPGLMALWYVDGLLASGTQFALFRDKLENLRESWSDSIDEVNIPFQFPYVPGELIVRLTETAAQEFLDGSYTEWDSLNTLFYLDRADTMPAFSTSRMVLLSFKGRLHPKYLAEYYVPLEGVESVTPNGYAGDWSNLYPWMVGDRVTFLARYAWGDCPSGCLNSHFYYFRENETGEMEFIGDWETGFDIENPDPEPDWWTEARAAYDFYFGRN